MHFLTHVRHSMLSSRRTRPIPQDFLQALHSHQLPLRALIPHLDPPVSSSLSQFTLGTEGPLSEEGQFSSQDALLNREPDRKPKLYIPRHFPELPSTYTYRETPQFPEREKDPRKIRELATEEGRLGEEALRRLLSAASDQRLLKKTPPDRTSKSLREKRDELWRETMLNVAAESDKSTDGNDQNPHHNGDQVVQPGTARVSSGHLSSGVNADRRYWRKAVAKS